MRVVRFVANRVGIVVAIDGYASFVPIAKGGFSQVYEAIQVDLGRKVAVKVLSVENGAMIDRNAFSTECRAMGALSSHPNVVTVFDSGFSTKGHPFIVMELCTSDLASRIRGAPDRCIEPGEVAAIGAGIADALDRAHSAGILHRDIKPQNVLFTDYGAVLSDFGIASLPGEGRSGQSWALSSHYAAPEIIDEEAYTVSCDLYSLGATLYTALAGRRPFVAEGSSDPAALRERIRTAQPPPITRQPVPDALERYIRVLMAKHPQDRPRSAAEVASRLSELARQLSSGSTPPRGVDGRRSATAATSTAAATGASSIGASVNGGVSDRLSPDRAESHGSGSAGSEADDSLAVTTMAREDARNRPTEDFVEHEERNRRPMLALLGLAGVLVAVALFAFVFGGGDDPDCQGLGCDLDNAEVARPVAPAIRPEPPSEASAAFDDEGLVVLAWERVEEAVTYRVVPDNTAYDFISTTETSIAVERERIGPSANPCVRVRALSEGGQMSAPSEQVCVPDLDADEPLPTMREVLESIDDVSEAADLAVSLSFGTGFDNPNGGPFTFFVPNNGAVDLALRDGLSPDELGDRLAFHAISNHVLVWPDVGRFYSTMARSTLVLSDGQLPGGAQVLESHPASNGIVHVIDVMLEPGSDEETIEEQVADLNSLEPIEFESNSSDIAPGARWILDEAVRILSVSPEGTRLEVQGHTDSKGTDEANQLLSEQRASAVVDALVALGVSRDLLVPVGFGESDLLEPGNTEADHQRNRRIEWVDISPGR